MKIVATNVVASQPPEQRPTATPTARAKMWGKVSSDKCRCGSKQTLNHILNCCGPSLREGRYTFRHDNVLSYVSRCLNKSKFKCYIDIEGSQTSAGGTLPPNLVVSTLKPDIVIIDKASKTVSILREKYNFEEIYPKYLCNSRPVVLLHFQCKKSRKLGLFRRNICTFFEQLKPVIIIHSEKKP